MTAIDRIADALDRIALALEADVSGTQDFHAMMMAAKAASSVEQIEPDPLTEGDPLAGKEWRKHPVWGWAIYAQDGTARQPTDAEAEAIRARIRPTERRR